MTGYISVIIAFLGFLASIYYSNKNTKRQDVESLQKEIARDTEINVKLDNIIQSTSTTDRKIEKIQENLDELKSANIAMSHDFDALESRVNKIEKRLELLHQEHREHMAKFDSIGMD